MNVNFLFQPMWRREEIPGNASRVDNSTAGVGFLGGLHLCMMHEETPCMLSDFGCITVMLL